MAARFPQSTSSLGWRIKPAWASKIHAIWWAADADKLHRLMPGNTTTTIIPRSASGTTYNSTEGRIEGNSSVEFEDSVSGGFGALRENSNFVFGGAFFGDLFYGTAGARKPIISSLPMPNTFNDGVNMTAIDFGLQAVISGGNGAGPWTNSGLGEDVATLSCYAARVDQTDSINDFRGWFNGAENVAMRTNVTLPANTNLIGDTARPLYLAGNFTGAGNTKVWFECAFLCAVLSDADMVTLTTNPADVLEVAAATGPTINTSPSNAIRASGQTATFTVSATTSGGTLSFQWEVNTGTGYGAVSGGTGANATSYTTPTLSTANNGHFYRCKVTDDNGFTYSSPASLTVSSGASAIPLLMYYFRQHGVA